MIEQGLATEPTSSHPQRRLLLILAHRDPAHGNDPAHDDDPAHES